MWRPRGVAESSLAVKTPQYLASPPSLSRIMTPLRIQPSPLPPFSSRMRAVMLPSPSSAVLTKVMPSAVFQMPWPPPLISQTPLALSNLALPLPLLFMSAPASPMTFVILPFLSSTGVSAARTGSATEASSPATSACISFPFPIVSSLVASGVEFANRFDLRMVCLFRAWCRAVINDAADTVRLLPPFAGFHHLLSLRWMAGCRVSGDKVKVRESR